MDINRGWGFCHLRRHLFLPSLPLPMSALVLFIDYYTMPNNCMWYLRIGKVNREEFLSIKNLVKRNLFDKHVRPQPKEVRHDSRMWKLFSEAEDKYIKETWHWRDKERREEAERRRPYKWLWYDWNCEHWWNKRGMCEAGVDSINHWRDWYEVQINFRTARSPYSEEFIAKVSAKRNSPVYYEYNEPWMNFSWRMWAENWEITQSEQFDDAFYWEWLRCENCWACYSAVDESDWANGNSDWAICYYCAEELLREFRDTGKVNEIVHLIAEVDTNLPDDEYRRQIVDKIYNHFSLSMAWAEYILTAYNEGLLLP